MSKAFTNYSAKNIVDITKSNFTYSPFSLMAGSSIAVTVNIVDFMYQPVNLTNNSDALLNLTVRIVYPSTNPSEYTRKLVRNTTFIGSTLLSNGGR